MASRISYLELDKAIILLIDVQGKLATLMHQHEELFARLQCLLEAANELDLPVLPVEQLPEKLGSTIECLSSYLPSDIVSKSSFSATGSEAFMSALKASGRGQVIVAGIEAHICVYQTVKGLLSQGYEVTVLTDCIASRKLASKDLALSRMQEEGAAIANLELVLFELMKDAEHPAFRQIQKLIK